MAGRANPSRRIGESDVVKRTFGTMMLAAAGLLGSVAVAKRRSERGAGPPPAVGGPVGGPRPTPPPAPAPPPPADRPPRAPPPRAGPPAEFGGAPAALPAAVSAAPPPVATFGTPSGP